MVLWGAWHILTNDLWAAEVSAAGLPLSLYVTVSGLTLLVGQLPGVPRAHGVGLRSHPSLLLAMLMHASLVFSTFVLGPAAIAGVPILVYGIASVPRCGWWSRWYALCPADPRSPNTSRGGLTSLPRRMGTDCPRGRGGATSSTCWLWLIVRVYVGYEFLEAGCHKFTDPAWMNGTGAGILGLLAGTTSTNPVLAVLGVLLVLAWKNAGWIGLDRYLLRLGTPWKQTTPAPAVAPPSAIPVAS